MYNLLHEKEYKINKKLVTAAASRERTRNCQFEARQTPHI